MAEDWPQPTRAQEMSEMSKPDIKWKGAVGLAPVEALYAELRGRGQPVTPKETVAHIAGLDARIAHLTYQRDAAVHALTAMSAARNQEAAECDEAKEAWSRAATERDEALDLAAHNEMLMRMAEARAKELEADYADLLDRNEGLEADLDIAVEVAWEHGAHEWVRLTHSFLYRILALHSPRAAASLAPLPLSGGREELEPVLMRMAEPVAAYGPENGSAALSRAMGAPALAGPAAWMGDD